uniref:Uncharacterized protein n=1 Tax=Candidatus Kentrum sp. LPFa TaxID=2126335 RepID=A0A450Y3I8_9GAMM|nr:MAG: hypothetical protein BECKLPF1236A_GA0070988_104722 [Candidatus Kentron sp. LPFa]VFK36107.1 MAG: hypothetical protein BECKLPF1236C_GA0070990_104882 [Candidatus Kentron sp. LPFa]
MVRMPRQLVPNSGGAGKRVEKREKCGEIRFPGLLRVLHWASRLLRLPPREVGPPGQPNETILPLTERRTEVFGSQIKLVFVEIALS